MGSEASDYDGIEMTAKDIPPMTPERWLANLFGCNNSDR